MNSKVVLGCHFAVIGGSAACSTILKVAVSRDKSRLVLASLIDGTTQIAMMPPYIERP